MNSLLEIVHGEENITSCDQCLRRTLDSNGFQLPGSVSPQGEKLLEKPVTILARCAGLNYRLTRVLWLGMASLKCTPWRIASDLEK
jgi:hypothetical protein